LTTKDSVVGMEEHGTAVISFQLTLLLCLIIGVPRILLFGLGIILLVFEGILSIVMPVIYVIRASNGKSSSYFGII